MTHFAALSHRATRRFVAWLLIGLVPLQGMAAGVLAAVGPAHVHQDVPAATLVLVDFRRAATPARARDVHVAAAFGHFHCGGAALRHDHPRSDASVVFVGDGAAAQDVGNEGPSAGASFALFTAMLPASIAWHAPTRQSAPASCAAWPPLTDDPEPLERPPRAG